MMHGSWNAAHQAANAGLPVFMMNRVGIGVSRIDND
jgi:hypothetical protein